MKPTAFLKFTLALISFCVNAQESIVLPIDPAYRNAFVNISLQSGSIEIVGHDKNEFIIDVQLDSLKTETKTTKNKNGFMRLGNNAFDIDITNSENRLDIKSYSSKGLKKLVINVPSSSDMSIVTNKGNLVVDAVHGKLDVTSNYGKIDIKGINGSVVASCPNGNVAVDFVEIDKKAPSSITSLNGKIEVSVPKKSSVSFNLLSIEGGIYSNFDMQLTPKVKSYYKNTDNGTYTSIKKWMIGTLNKGGPSIFISTVHSDIYLKTTKD
ncbi:MAG: DUF4097 family beta strand repeat-containing protein [Bacteroidota bacterium]